MIISQLSDIFCTILIMSLSGSALILLLLALKPLIRHRLSKSVQYALWLITLAALIVPVSKLIAIPEAPTKIVVEPIQTVVEQNIFLAEEETNTLPLTNTDTNSATEATATPAVTPAPDPVLTATVVFIMLNYLLIVVAVLFYYIVSYIRFTKKVRRHRTRARMEELYEHVGLCGDTIAPRLYRSALVTTPMLIGIFKPEIILPDREYTEGQIQSVLKHELTHMRRRDIIFKWLSVFACALHWFNPLAWLARREVDRICELSCDEAVVRNLDHKGKQNYGETLISIATDTSAPRAVLSTTMCEEKEVLKERLNVIMKYQKRTWIAVAVSTVIVVAAVIAVCVFGAGAVPSSAPVDYKVDALQGDLPSATPEATVAAVNVQPSTAPKATIQPVSIQSDTPSMASETSTQPEPIQSFYESSSTLQAPDPDDINELRKNAIEVGTKSEFADALLTANVIVLKKDITIDDEFMTLEDIKALVIDEGVTLTVTCMNLHAKCAIINLGEIIVADSGRLMFFSEPDYATIGKISVKGKNAKILYGAGKVGAEAIAYFLSEDSLFNELSLTPPYREGETVEILVDQDITIPAGKTLWMNAHSVLHVAEGVTLTNNGAIRYYVEPVVDGKIDGIGKVIYDN